MNRLTERKLFMDYIKIKLGLGHLTDFVIRHRFFKIDGNTLVVNVEYSI